MPQQSFWTQDGIGTIIGQVQGEHTVWDFRDHDYPKYNRLVHLRGNQYRQAIQAKFLKGYGKPRQINMVKFVNNTTVENSYGIERL